MRPAAFIFALTLVTAPVLSQESESSPLPCDSSAIQWLLPGRFEEARERARKENRLLLIKGVSFGIDAVGARSPTKGRW